MGGQPRSRGQTLVYRRQFPQDTMSTNNSLMPKEAAALIQHIELNRAGWWDKAVHRLVLAAVWLSDEPPGADTIQASLIATFRLTLSTQKLSSALVSLESHKMLVRLQNDTYRIPDQQRTVFEQEIAASEKVESEAKETFCKLVGELGAGLESEAVWAAFEHEFLAPLIKLVGANAYRLIAGEKMTVDQSLVDCFLKRFAEEHHPKLNALVTKFLDPKRPEVRAYISRMLHARFCVEASGLPEDVLAKLNASVGKQIRFRLFVDTNFLFSLLELHENPSNAAAQELRELVAQLMTNPKIELVITPGTIEEAKSSISYTKGQLSGIPAGRNFTQAALQVGFSGMAVRFLSERLRRNGKLTAEEWFDPYLNDFVPIARSKGVELFNEKLDGYATRQDVVDDIHVVFKYEEKLPPAKRKSYPKVAHDMVLWHFVNDKRSAYIESPIDASDWILTVDFRLIGFDEHKQKHSGSKVPLCIHPTSLIQLLQFWVPRTKEFEEAMLGSLRLPFLFQDFDADAERTSLKILKGIGRFEGSDNLPQEAITQVMLNDGLRSRLKTGQTDDAEIALIRDALVEEMKLRADAEAKRAEQLRETVQQREAALAALADQKKATEEENALIKKQKAEAQADANERLVSQGAKLDVLKSKMQAMEDAEQARVETAKREKLQRQALFAYFGLLAVVIAVSVVAVWQAAHIFPWYAKVLGQFPTSALAGVIIFLFGHLLLEWWMHGKPLMVRLWPFRQVKRFRKALWTLVIVGFLGGVAGNIYANRIQKQLDDEKNSPSSANKVPADAKRK